MLLFGRVVSDNDEKMTEKSVQLECSRAMGSGVRIPLDLSQCQSFAIFPGQLACFEGRNPDGSRFIVSEQKRLSKSPVSVLPAGVDKYGSGPATILVAAGPYSMDTGALDLSPIDKLLMFALDRKPDLLLLVPNPD